MVHNQALCIQYRFAVVEFDYSAISFIFIGILDVLYCNATSHQSGQADEAGVIWIKQML